MLLLPTAWSSVCNESVTADQFHQNQSDRIYPIYKKLETILTNDKETLYAMKQAFFPALEPHFWESARINVVKIRVCVITDETMMKCNSSSGNNSMFIKTQCWKFLWSSSPALTKITSGQLFSFDPVVAVLIYIPTSEEADIEVLNSYFTLILLSFHAYHWRVISHRLLHYF